MSNEIPNQPTKSMTIRRWKARLLFVPAVCWNILLGRVLQVRHWWDEIDDHVLQGALPFASDVAKLHQAGVRAVVNACDEYAGPIDAYRRAGMVQLRVPTVDFTQPSIEAIERAVGFINEHVAQQQGVYVHCRAGKARSGTIVLCYLIAKHGMTPEEAQQRILDRRPHADRNLHRRPVVQQFWRKHHESIFAPADDA